MRTLRAFLSCCVSVVVVALVLAFPGTAQADGPGVGPPAIVSMGDSSISGEGGRWAGNAIGSSGAAVDALGTSAYWDNGSSEKISGCHRSKTAEVHIGGGVISENLACSGAMTSTWNINGDGWKPGLDIASTTLSDGTKRYGQVLQLGQYARTHNVKAIVVGVGANNYGFGEVVKRCMERYYWTWEGVKNYCFSGTDDADMISRFDAAHAQKVAHETLSALTLVHKEMQQAGYQSSDYTIILQTYWSAIPHGSEFAYGESAATFPGGSMHNSRISLGGCGVFNADADWLNDTVLDTINAGIYWVKNALQTDISTGRFPNTVVLNMEHALDGHRLCEFGTGYPTSWQQAGAVDLSEWVVAARAPQVFTNYYESVESGHANYSGAARRAQLSATGVEWRQRERWRLPANR